jgi:hypothetical protein
MHVFSHGLNTSIFFLADYEIITKILLCRSKRFRLRMP